MNDLISLWTRHETELRRWLMPRVPVPSEVDDILQDVFIKVLRQGKALSAVDQPRAWLFEVTRNTLTDRLRARRDGWPLPDGLDELPDAVESEHPLDGLAQACLPRVLSELDPQDRDVIELCDLQGMTQAEFARQRQLSLPAVKSRLQRARKRMRERMTSACRVSFDSGGRVDDFVPRTPPS
ncbi:MAG: sigma-70 family RNA polymerase sigma factor [Hydrogenophaga sp.]|nr:sigma-70 family RNA polymerase sigma factor [Hydrogenophaga sp.]